MLVYHGTHEPEAIRRDGFRLPDRYCHDTLGRGIYTSTSYEEAAKHGTVLECWLDTAQYAVVPNPYFMNAWGWELERHTEAEALFYELAFCDGKMLTVQGDCLARLRTAKRIQEAMLSVGYAGLITEYRGTCVAYDLGTISLYSSMELLQA